MGDAAELYLILVFIVLPLLLLMLFPVSWGCRRLFPQEKVYSPEVRTQLFSGTQSPLRYYAEKKKKAGVLFAVSCILVINFGLFQPKLEGVGTKSRSRQRPPCQGPIDVLITWVDTSDPEWQDEGNAAGCNVDRMDSGGAGGDIDPYEALRFSMRSLYQHVPWIRNVYIFGTGQKPAWLKLGGRVNIIKHADVVNRTLFSGRLSESLLGEFGGTPLKGKCFLKSDDDFLWLRDVPREALFPNNYPGGVGGEPLPTASWLNRKFHAAVTAKIGAHDFHSPYPIYRDSYRDFCAKDEHCTRAQHEARVGNVCNNDWCCMDFYSKYRIAGNGLFSAPAYTMSMLAMRIGGPSTLIEYLSNHLRYMLRFIFRPFFAHINSHGGFADTPEGVKAIRRWLLDKYPDPAPWELSDQPEWAAKIRKEGSPWFSRKF